MATRTDWSQHERQAARCKGRMTLAMRNLARAVKSVETQRGERIDGYDTDNEYRVEFRVRRPHEVHDSLSSLGKNTLGVSLALCDSGDADDGVYGVHGNFTLDIVEEGGRVVGSCSPMNYTPEVWVDYADDAEFDRRLEGLIAGMDETKRMIEAWKVEARR